MAPRTFILASAALLGTALLTGQPVSAQQSTNPSVPYNPDKGGHYGYEPPAGTPVTPGSQGSQGTIPPVAQQNRSAEEVQGSTIRREVEPLLHQADAALRKRNFGVANELLERAQTAAMNADAYHAPGSLASAVAEARSAMVDRDVPLARRRIATVLDTLRLGASAAADDPGTGAVPTPRR